MRFKSNSKKRAEKINWNCIVPYNILSYNFAECYRKYTWNHRNLCQTFPIFLKTEYKFLFNSSTKYDVSETTTDLPKLKIACHGKPYIRPAAVNMRHDASHRLPGTDDQDKKLMTADNVTSAYCSLGSYQRLFISEQSFQFSQGHMISFLNFISTLWGEKSAWEKKKRNIYSFVLCVSVLRNCRVPGCCSGLEVCSNCSLFIVLWDWD